MIQRFALLALLLAAPAAAQVTTIAPPAIPGAKPVRVERITVHSPAIEGNLEGESPDRTVLVMLPPGYAASPKRRYPVVYALHGYSIGAEQWTREIHAPQTVEGAFAQGAAEMIVVLPDSKTVYNGSAYSSSITTGDFETFIARDLVAYIDSHYRTIADRRSRGLAGHSMGGYGATRIGMKHADTFGALYVMSPGGLTPRMMGVLDAEGEKTLRALRSPAESASLSWALRAQLALAAAWAPNPKAPPLYLDLPLKDGQPQPDVIAKFTANAPLAFFDQYAGSLRRYRAIAIDVGDRDSFRVDAAALHAALDKYGIANTFEEYPGDHTSGLGVRFQSNLLPFFARSLWFGR